MEYPLYNYQPLSPIGDTRIIELEPALSMDAPLRCRIKELRLACKDEDEYEAISYTWGKPNFTQPLLIESDSVDTVMLMRITPNLDNALQRFRLTDRRRRLWVDAICINQDDIAEKAKQIPSMPQIYRGASTVLAWLGYSIEGVESIMHIRTSLKYSPNDPAEKQNYDSKLLSALEGLVSLPWFTRRWVVQEAVLASEALLVCGFEEIRLFHVVRALSTLLRGTITANEANATAIAPLIAIANLWKTWVFDTSSNNGLRMLDLLVAFGDTDCENDLDRVFALCGLASDVILHQQDPKKEKYQRKLFLKIDYDVSTSDLYREIAWHSMRSEAASGWSYKGSPILIFSILSRCNASSRSVLPWWAPDWRLPTKRDPIWPPEGYLSIAKLLNETLFRRRQTIDYLPRMGFQLGFREMDEPAILKRKQEKFWMQGTENFHTAMDIVRQSLRESSETLTISWLSKPFPTSLNRSDIAAWLQNTRGIVYESGCPFGERASDKSVSAFTSALRDIVEHFCDRHRFSDVVATKILEYLIALKYYSSTSTLEIDAGILRFLRTCLRGRVVFGFSQKKTKGMTQGIGLGPDHISLGSIAYRTHKPKENLTDLKVSFEGSLWKSVLYFTLDDANPDFLIGDGIIIKYH